MNLSKGYYYNSSELYINNFINNIVYIGPMLTLAYIYSNIITQWIPDELPGASPKINNVRSPGVMDTEVSLYSGCYNFLDIQIKNISEIILCWKLFTQFSRTHHYYLLFNKFFLCYFIA